MYYNRVYLITVIALNNQQGK